MACINQWERPKFSHFSQNPFKVDKTERKRRRRRRKRGRRKRTTSTWGEISVAFFFFFIFFYCQSCVYYGWIVMHNFTQIKNRDFKSWFQLKNEMCVKLWVRTYVQQVLPITTGSLIPTINYYYYFL